MRQENTEDAHHNSTPTVNEAAQVGHVPSAGKHIILYKAIAKEMGISPISI